MNAQLDLLPSVHPNTALGGTLVAETTKRGSTPWHGRERSEAAGIIRRCVWPGGKVPPSPDRYPWSMARELHAWQRIVDGGTDPALLNAGLVQLRSVMPAAHRVTYLLAVPGLLGDVLAAAKAATARERPGASRSDVSTFANVGDVLAGLGL